MPACFFGCLSQGSHVVTPPLFHSVHPSPFLSISEALSWTCSLTHLLRLQEGQSSCCHGNLKTHFDPSKKGASLRDPPPSLCLAEMFPAFSTKAPQSECQLNHPDSSS